MSDERVYAIRFTHVDELALWSLDRVWKTRKEARAARDRLAKMTGWPLDIVAVTRGQINEMRKQKRT